MKKIEEYKPFPYVAWFLVVSFTIFTLALTIEANAIMSTLAVA